MREEQTTIYVTDDGKKHTSKRDALLHEINTELRQEGTGHFSSLAGLEDMAQFVMGKPRFVGEICRRIVDAFRE